MGVPVMKKRRKRRSFTDDYRAEVVRLVETSGKSIGQIAADLDLTETAVRAWVKAAKESSRTPRRARRSSRCHPPRWSYCARSSSAAARLRATARTRGRRGCASAGEGKASKSEGGAVVPTDGGKVIRFPGKRRG